MREITITIKVQLPDDRDEANKLVTLLINAKNAAAQSATDYIGEIDHDYAMLNSALPNPRPAEYSKLIKELYNKSTQWRNAMELSQKIMWGAIGPIFDTLHPKEEGDDAAR